MIRTIVNSTQIKRHGRLAAKGFSLLDGMFGAAVFAAGVGLATGTLTEALWYERAAEVLPLSQNDKATVIGQHTAGNNVSAIASYGIVSSITKYISSGAGAATTGLLTYNTTTAGAHSDNLFDAATILQTPTCSSVLGVAPAALSSTNAGVCVAYVWTITGTNDYRPGNDI